MKENKYQEALNYLFKISFAINKEQKEKKYEAISILQELIDSVNYMEYCGEKNDKL